MNLLPYSFLLMSVMQIIMKAPVRVSNFYLPGIAKEEKRISIIFTNNFHLSYSVSILILSDCKTAGVLRLPNLVGCRDFPMANWNSFK